MTTLVLTEEEQKLLSETLASCKRDLKMEVLHTDSHEFKQMLKQRESALNQLLEKVGHSDVPA